MKVKSADVGVIIGRFQVNELHEAHLDLIQTVVDNHSKVIIFLGVSPLKCTFNNPLDFESRKQMIQEKFPRINILYIKDVPCDMMWSKNLDNQIKDLIGPSQTVLLYGGRSSFLSLYRGEFQCVELEQESFISGKEIRKRLSNQVDQSKTFRAGVIWVTMNQYINAVPCIDLIIFNEEKTKILLGRKPLEKKYRFPGGFVNSGETYEEAAKREGYEETALELNDFKYLFSSVVNDWRYKKEKIKITTAVFECQYVFGLPEAKDDLEELRWFNISEFDYKISMVTGHQILFEKYLAMKER